MGPMLFCFLAFPFLVSSMTLPNKRMIHLNHAGASPCRDEVLDTIMDHYRLEQAVGAYAAARQANLDQVYQNIATLIGSESIRNIALVESATMGWTRLFYAMAKQQHRHGKCTILVSEVEYAANLVACCQWSQENEWEVLAIPSTKDANGEQSGKVCLSSLRSMLMGTYAYPTDSGDFVSLNPETIGLVCITHIPTNAGVINPVGQIGELLEAFNKRKGDSIPPSIYYLVDACQSVGQVSVNATAMACHGLVASGRKYLAGPRGTGFLYVHPATTLEPDHVDHFSTPVKKVPTESVVGRPLQQSLEYSARPDARRFEFWESNVALKLGMGVAVRHILQQGLDEHVAPTILNRATYLAHRLLEMDSVILHHGLPECGLVTFWAKNIASSLIHERLNESGFSTSVVPATSTPLDSAVTGVPDLVRSSVSYTTTREEIEFFVDAVKLILEGEMTC